MLNGRALIVLSGIALTPMCEVEAAVTFAWATVGAGGNVPDTEVMASDNSTGYGAVAYEFQIAKTEVTNAQYAEFLNAVAKTDTWSLYNTSMATSESGGILRSGVAGSYTYAVKPNASFQHPNSPAGTLTSYSYAQKPVNFLTFHDAVRFANWLHNGQPTGAQDVTTTEDGAYTITVVPTVMRITRNAGARFAVPTEDEWYKAAYYDPQTGAYYDYPTSSDTAPTNSPPGADDGNSANVYHPGSPTGDHATGSSNYTKTDVGSYDLTTSPFGVFDMAGNVGEWTEGKGGYAGRGVRRGGGAYAEYAFYNHANFRDTLVPGLDNEGLRIVQVPEPASLSLLAFAGFLTRRRH